MEATTPNWAKRADVAILDQLDVLDAVMDAGGGTGCFVGVERGLDGAVANGVGDALETGFGEEGDGFGVALRLRPEGVESLSLACPVRPARRCRSRRRRP